MTRNAAWTNTNDSCWNKTSSCQDDALWYITRSYEWSCWELEQNKNKFLFWPPPCLFRIARGYLLHSLIFPPSLLIFKDFGMLITNTAVCSKIFIFQKWILFPIWASLCFVYLCLHYYILPSASPILSPNGILFIKQYFQIKSTNNLQHVLYNTRGMEHSGL